MGIAQKLFFEMMTHAATGNSALFKNYKSGTKNYRKRANNKPHQGEREKARRRRQMGYE